MVANLYSKFKDKLFQLISKNSDLETIAMLLLEDNYINILCKKIAAKYNIDSEDLRSELVLRVINNQLLASIIQGQHSFNGKVFEFNVINIAKSLAYYEHLEDIDDLDEIDTTQNNAVQVVCSNQQLLKYEQLMRNKLNQLLEYRNNINKISEYCEIVELTIEELASKLGVKRNLLIRHPINYKKQLIEILNQYIQLYTKWYSRRSIFLTELVEKYGSTTSLYQALGLNYSYRKFIDKIDSLSLWQIEEVCERLGVNNV